MTTTQQRNYIDEWINENDTFHMERYAHVQTFIKDREGDISILKAKAEKKETDIKMDPEGWLAKLKQGRTMGYNDKDDRHEELLAYKHPVHDNEALFIQEMPNGQVVYRIKDCYGDFTHFLELGDALAEFLGVEGDYMWIYALSINHHSNKNIWI